MKTKNKPIFSLLVFLVTVSCSYAAINPSSSNPTSIPLATLRNTTAEETIQPKAEVSQPTITPGVNAATEPATAVEVEFNQSTANPSVPSGILQEITFYGGGGGSRCTGNETSPTLSFEPLDGELMTLSTMIVCGWQRNQTLKATVQYPDGKIITQDLNVLYETWEGPHAMLSFRPTIEDPAGAYTFILEGNDGTVQAEALFSKPNGPGLFRKDDSHLLVYGFVPYESVRLFSYARGGKFAGWQEYAVDSTGQLSVKIPVAAEIFETYYWIIGDQSGETHLLQEDYWGRTVEVIEQRSIQENVQNQFCGSLRSRLSIGDSARVAFTDGSDMRIRQSAGLHAEILYRVPEGTTFMVIDESKCSDNIIWWKVRTTDGIEGWMAEFMDGVYLLEPLS